MANITYNTEQSLNLDKIIHSRFSGTVLPTNRRTAEELDQKFYFTNQPCTRGHLAPRYTSSGNCLKCAMLSITNKTIKTIPNSIIETLKSPAFQKASTDKTKLKSVWMYLYLQFSNEAHYGFYEYDANPINDLSDHLKYPNQAIQEVLSELKSIGYINYDNKGLMYSPLFTNAQTPSEA